MFKVNKFFSSFVFIAVFSKRNMKHAHPVSVLYLNKTVSVEELSADSCPTKFDLHKINIWLTRSD